MGLLPAIPETRPRRDHARLGEELPAAASRCSSSPGPAPAAARRRTSSCSPSCSATASWSPTPPAVRRSTAATCRPPRGPRTATAAARRGRTRCSRTTPSSVSACGSASSTTSATLAAGRRALDDVGADLATRCSRTRSRPRPASSSATRSVCATLATSARRPDDRRCAHARRDRRRTRAHEHVDRRRRRLGLRHRLRRRRPRARVGRNVNLLVLDTEVYSNTGGQASKATPLGAVAKFALAASRPARRTSARSPAVRQRLRGPDRHRRQRHPDRQGAAEADAWDGPSLIIAYSTCIAHGIDMATSMSHQKDAVKSGYWPLYRYKPTVEEHEHPFQLDSAAPSIPLTDFALKEARFAMLARSDPERSANSSTSPSRTSTSAGTTTSSSPAGAHGPSHEIGRDHDAGAIARTTKRARRCLTCTPPTSACRCGRRSWRRRARSPATRPDGRARARRRRAVVLPSLFEEQIEHETAEIDRLFTVHGDSFNEATSFFPSSTTTTRRRRLPGADRGRQGASTSR